MNELFRSAAIQAENVNRKKKWRSHFIILLGLASMTSVWAGPVGSTPCQEEKLNEKDHSVYQCSECPVIGGPGPTSYGRCIQGGKDALIKENSGCDSFEIRVVKITEPPPIWRRSLAVDLYTSGRVKCVKVTVNAGKAADKAGPLGK